MLRFQAYLEWFEAREKTYDINQGLRQDSVKNGLYLGRGPCDFLLPPDAGISLAALGLGFRSI